MPVPLQENNSTDNEAKTRRRRRRRCPQISFTQQQRTARCRTAVDRQRQQHRTYLRAGSHILHAVRVRHKHSRRRQQAEKPYDNVSAPGGKKVRISCRLEIHERSPCHRKGHHCLKKTSPALPFRVISAYFIIILH